jgi:tetratricopeptide (TPR) repeat protein
MKLLLHAALTWTLAGILVNCARAEHYVAFSLNSAQRLIVQARDRPVPPQVRTLAGLSKIRGLVYDHSSGDVILVGEDKGGPQLLLDDFVVALRARRILQAWPLVSIDPPSGSILSHMQSVRYEGGIENTAFGKTLYEADLLLKRISLGLVEVRRAPLASYWQLMRNSVWHENAALKLCGRFWFYPVRPAVKVRSGVVEVSNVEVGLFTELLYAEADGAVLAIDGRSDPRAEQFRTEFERHFTTLAIEFPVLARLDALNQLVALTKGLEETEDAPNLDYWLTRYTPERTVTVNQSPTLRRYAELRRPNERRARTIELSGGVQLKALAIRLKAGDVTALRDAVLASRPSPNELAWGFTIGEWLIPDYVSTVSDKEIGAVTNHAAFLTQKGRHAQAAELYGYIIAARPDDAMAYALRGEAYRAINRIESALKDFDRAIQLNPSSEEFYSARGNVRAARGDGAGALADYAQALRLNPKFVRAYHNRALLHSRERRLERALADYSEALHIGSDAFLFAGRARVYEKIGRDDDAAKDYSTAIALDPTNSAAHKNLGALLYRKGRIVESIEQFDRAIALNPRDAGGYSNRATAYSDLRRFDQAMADFASALRLDANHATAYVNRGRAYDLQGRSAEARADFDKALAINPSETNAYVYRARVLAIGGEFDSAIADCLSAIGIDPSVRSTPAMLVLGMAYEQKGDFTGAMEAYQTFIAMADQRYAAQVESAQKQVARLLPYIKR